MRAALLAAALGVLAGACSKPAATPPARDPIESIVEHAVAIQRSLSHDVVDGVAEHAGGIAADAAALGKPGEAIVAGAAALRGAGDIKDARVAFGAMSEGLVAYLDGAKRKPGGGVRVAFCPMVLKPWLQQDGAIQNPYYGSQMLSCGSFRQ